jgi:metal-sulfur cluster biosynthetic enzyme
MIREDVEAAVAAVAGVVSVQVDEVLEPWSREDVTPRGRELLRAVAVV